MPAKKGYNTKQKNRILHCLQAMPGAHAGAEGIAAKLREEGEEIGQATVYRNLEKLVREGLVLKYTLPGGQSACFQYTGPDCGPHPHCHVICEECGHITPLDCSSVDSFAAHLLAEHGFALNRHKTVLYGLCGACREAQT